MEKTGNGDTRCDSPVAVNTESWTRKVQINLSDGTVVTQEHISHTTANHHKSGVSATTTSSYTVGPIKVGFVDATRNQRMDMFIRYACPSEADNLSLWFSADGNIYEKVGDFPSLPIIWSENIKQQVAQKYLTDTLHVRIQWSGSQTPGLKAGDCYLFKGETGLFFHGPLDGGLSKEEEMRRGYYQIVSGTSIAAPIVAGAVRDAS